MYVGDDSFKTHSTLPIHDASPLAARQPQPGCRVMVIKAGGGRTQRRASRLWCLGKWPTSRGSKRVGETGNVNYWSILFMSIRRRTFVVNRSTFDEDVRKKTIFSLHFRSQWPSLLTFRPQILLPWLLLSSAMFPPNSKFVWLSYFEKIEGTGTGSQTNGQTDAVNHLMRPPREAAL